MATVTTILMPSEQFPTPTGPMGLQPLVEYLKRIQASIPNRPGESQLIVTGITQLGVRLVRNPTEAEIQSQGYAEAVAALTAASATGLTPLETQALLTQITTYQ